jgi:ABC-type lipoprotein release transport system permease subunit
VIRTASADPDVVAAVPLVALPGAIGKDGVFRNALVIGVDGSAPRKPFVVAAGAPLAPGDDRGILVGASIAQRMSIAIGDAIELRVVTHPTTGDEGVAKMTMTVRGTATGTFVAPEAVFVDRKLLAEELVDKDPATLIAIDLVGGADVDAVAARLAAALPEHGVRTWKEDSTFASSAIASSAALGSLSRWMVGFAVVVPVWALLYIHVLHRRRAIAVINALGIGRGALFAVYLLQALLVGLAGAAIGGALGAGAIRFFDAYPIFRMDIFEVRPVVSAGTFAQPMLLVLAFTLAASVIPAWRAARTDPAAILRGRT